MPRIAIYVQHLLGAGHLVRSMSLAEALSEQGHQVLLLSGGFPIERPIKGYRFVQLPPLRAQSNFTRLVDEHAQPIDVAWRERRASELLEKVAAFRPNLVITETWPFGRRQFRFELEPLLDWVKQRPEVLLFASLRDILQRRSMQRNRETVALVRDCYDGVLVHGDANLFTLDASFPLADEIEDKLVYTGYIHQPALVEGGLPAGGADGRDEVIVSGGSGSVSARLLEIARLARPLSSAAEQIWRLLTGRSQQGGVEQPEAGLIMEPNRTDFISLLSRCALSISQAGYNTTLDILASGARSVMVPFAGEGETEQSDRARALAEAGRIVQLSESDLSPQNLAHAVDRALRMPLPKMALRLDGAATSARIISERLQQWKN